MLLIEKYFIVVLGAFEREPIVFDEEPTEKEIVEAINKLDGKSARVEKRYVLQES